MSDYRPGESVVIVSERVAEPFHAVLLHVTERRCCDCGREVWHLVLDNRRYADVCVSALTRPN